MNSKNGYTGKILRIDLSEQKIEKETVPEPVMKKYLGGAGLGAKYLYENVPADAKWDDPANVMFFGSGPLGSTVGGTGMVTIVTMGPQTEGAVSTQGNGFFGAYMMQSGFHGFTIQGVADDWVYLYIHDNKAELRPASHLLGKDTWETADLISEELGVERKKLSVFSIGVAGENQVKFSMISGDRGHVASKGGAGAVMGSKKVKAVVAKSDIKAFQLENSKTIKAIGREMKKNVQNHPSTTFDWGTSMLLPVYPPLGLLPMKNLNNTEFPEAPEFGGDHYRPQVELERHACWACALHHCHIFKIKDGPLKGYEGDEPEFEDMVVFGCLIDQKDPQAAMMLSDMSDRLGLDANECGWLLAMLMECYEKGIITKDDTDGVELTWGNVEAVKTMLNKIANRDGFGDIAAEGTMRAAEKLGAEEIGIYFNSGAVPRSHDHRARWDEMLDVATSSTSTMDVATASYDPEMLGVKKVSDPFLPSEVARLVSGMKGRRTLEDSLGICAFACRGSANNYLTDCLNAVTGWDWTAERVSEFGHMVANLLRSFDIRQGHDIEKEAPSARYSSTPTYGPAKGLTVVPHWREMKSMLYKNMGWDTKTGAPLRETLERHGLDWVIKDLYS